MQVLMPQIGMTMVEGIIEVWLKKDGEMVQKGEAILEFSTEKMTNTLEAPESGTLKIIAKEGEAIACGKPVAEIS